MDKKERPSLKDKHTDDQHVLDHDQRTPGIGKYLARPRIIFIVHCEDSSSRHEDDNREDGGIWRAGSEPEGFRAPCCDDPSIPDESQFVAMRGIVHGMT